MKVGFIGTGLMGLPMVQRLIENGVEVVVYNRTQTKLEPLKKESKATIATQPDEVLHACECVILMLTDAEAIRSLLLGDRSRQQLIGRTVIQMGTISPTQSRAIRDEVVTAGGEYLEAPVLGSIPEAKTGKLIMMIGGSTEQFQRWLELFHYLGPEPILIGPVGSAAAVKLSLNQLIGSLTAAFALSLSFTQHQGVDPSLFMQVLRGSALYAPTFDKKLQRMLDRNYTNPNFPAKHLLKDTELFISEAESVNLNTVGIEGVRKILSIALAETLGEEDYSSIYSAINPDHQLKQEGL